MSGKNSGATTNTESGVKVPCEVYSRIVGYLRPVDMWNDGKRQEFHDRVTFLLPGDGGGGNFTREVGSASLGHG